MQRQPQRNASRPTVSWRSRLTGEHGGMGVGFSRDTHFDPELVKASEGLRLLIHEAFQTDKDTACFRCHRFISHRVGRAYPLSKAEP